MSHDRYRGNLPQESSIKAFANIAEILNPQRKPLTVVYPYAFGGDLRGPLLLTNATKFIFVHTAAFETSMSDFTHRMQQDAQTLGIQDMSITQEGEKKATATGTYKHPNSDMVTQRTMTFYDGDYEGGFWPKEAEDGYDVLVTKDIISNHQNPQQETRQLQKLRMGGIVLTGYLDIKDLNGKVNTDRELAWIIKPALLGFEPISLPEVQLPSGEKALAFRKVREVDATTMQSYFTVAQKLMEVLENRKANIMLKVNDNMENYKVVQQFREQFPSEPVFRYSPERIQTELAKLDNSMRELYESFVAVESPDARKSLLAEIFPFFGFPSRDEEDFYNQLPMHPDTEAFIKYFSEFF